MKSLHEMLESENVLQTLKKGKITRQEMFPWCLDLDFPPKEKKRRILLKKEKGVMSLNLHSLLYNKLLKRKCYNWSSHVSVITCVGRQHHCRHLLHYGLFRKLHMSGSFNFGKRSSHGEMLHEAIIISFWKHGICAATLVSRKTFSKDTPITSL